MSVEALPDVAEQHQCVDEDVWRSHREGVAVDPWTAMTIDAVEEQAGREDVWQGHGEGVSTGRLATMMMGAEEWQAVDEEAANSTLREVHHAETLTHIRPS